MRADEQNTFVVELKNGSESAFEKFINVYGVKIKGMAYNYVGDNETAKDIAQNVYIKVFRKITLFRNESKLSSWVYRIVINEIFMHYRKTKKIFLSELNETNGATSKIDGPEYSLLRTELGMVLMKSVQKLDPKERIIFTSRFFNEMTNNDVSNLLGIPVPAVKSRLFRGKKKLRKSNIGKYLLGEEICNLTKCSALRGL